MVISNFHEAKSYFESMIPESIPNSKLFGLNRIKALLSKMGNPQNAYATVHVGGTSGKGSTSTIIAEILINAGFKVGLHISPHLEDIREREQVNGKLMSESKFVQLTNYIKKMSEEISRETIYGAPTYFEMLLAIAFQYFKDENVDIAVIEVGLGGRLDGTNIILPKVAVITNVGLDHTEILGDTVEKIAIEKAGIIKYGIDVVSGVTQSSVVKIIENKSEEQKCKFDLINRDIFYNIENSEINKNNFNLIIHDRKINNIETSLLGEHQIRNIALAVDVIFLLNKHNFYVNEQNIKNAIKNIHIPGRFEILRNEPMVILDGAHNQMKIEALIKTLYNISKGNKVIMIFAAKKDKNVKEMISQLSKITSKFYFTIFEATTDFGKRFSYNPQELVNFTNITSEVFKNSKDAYEKAVAESKSTDVICITGSLYLVGELRKYIINNK